MRSSYTAGTPLPNLVALFAALVGLVTVVFVGHSIAMSATAHPWPTTAGTVLDSRIVEVDYSGGSPGSHFVVLAEVRYRYEVNGKAFESENLSYSSGQIGGVHRYYPPELAAQYPVGAAIRVSYDATDPTTAVADPSLSNHAYLKLIAGIVILVGGVYYLLTRGKRNLRAQA